MNTRKKGKSPLDSLIQAAKTSEQNIISNTTVPESNKNIPEDTISPDIENETDENFIKELPEEKESSDTKVEENQLPEKKDDPVLVNDRKKEYINIIKARNQKGPIEKANLFTPHRDFLKKIATAENISMQDLLANIIDNFKERYEPQIKQSAKKLLL